MPHRSTASPVSDVDGNGRVVIELARAPGEGGGASPDDAGLTFRLRSGGEEEGYAWIDSLKNESYARLKETNEFLAKQCDEFAGEIARLEDVRSLSCARCRIPSYGILLFARCWEWHQRTRTC